MYISRPFLALSYCLTARELLFFSTWVLRKTSHSRNHYIDRRILVELIKHACN